MKYEQTKSKFAKLWTLLTDNSMTLESKLNEIKKYLQQYNLLNRVVNIDTVDLTLEENETEITTQSYKEEWWQSV